MPDYLLAYHGAGMPETRDGMLETGGHHVALQAAWQSWYAELGPAIVDQGHPVRQARMVASDGSRVRGGGPDPVTGYTIIWAEGIDDAVSKATGCPILASGGSVEVCETDGAS